ncbi:FAD binding domain-containing protein [Nocardioides sp. zg-ZUI104]|uniref:xanthine dehydrogenase small subunit n=1 Tax=Nocardioides faecalis TaxID=2803858 RepID=UPI001BCBFF16|nr:FAD binding domain-containing protein [Nocardioides faecalis]MBS4753646.1 FAD binding domain-containing protein [Nocardioides faecalis]
MSTESSAVTPAGRPGPTERRGTPPTAVAERAAVVTVNGAPRPLLGAEPPVTALDWLRGLGLSGAKEGCAEGECGACAVLLARPGLDTATEWTALNACLLPAAALGGQEVLTAEGLGRTDALHPVQAELAVRGGSQCGYCTPGFVCAMAAEYYRPGRERFDHHALSGNLCRCTGYRPILEAADALGAAEETDPLAARRHHEAPVSLPARHGAWVRPADLAEALELLAEPGAVPVAGATDLGVAANLHGARPALLVAVDRLPELRELSLPQRPEEPLVLGAAWSLSELERRTTGGAEVLDLLHAVYPQFASRLIRNSATIGGNLGTGSPVGDLAPALLALDAEVVLVGAEGERTVALTDYFTGYRQSVRRPGELIRAVRIPAPADFGGHAPQRLVGFHKIAKRRYDDISSVAIALVVHLSDGLVTHAAIGLGGVAATPLRAHATEEALLGRPWDAATRRAASAVLAAEGTPLDDHRASAAYRRAMLGQALHRFHAEHAPAGSSAGEQSGGAA